MKESVALVGSGALTGQMAHFLNSVEDVKLAGVFDDYAKSGIDDLPLLGSLKDIVSQKHQYDKVLIGIGYKHLQFKERLYRELSDQGTRFYSFAHSSCVVDHTAVIEEGAFIYPGCVIDMRVVIGKNVLINNGCIISHDTTIGDASFLAPGVNISGNCKIGKCNFIGAGAVIGDGVTITDHVVIGAGSVVLKSIAHPGIYYGSPARFIKNE